jgi:hypothetical protein
MATTWAIAIDWDRSGNFNGTYDDVTEYVMSADWFLGMKTPYQDTANNSRLNLVLTNADKRFSPENESGPLWDNALDLPNAVPEPCSSSPTSIQCSLQLCFLCPS